MKTGGQRPPLQQGNHFMRVRLMLRDDISAGMQLVEAAGWNQTEADWERFLDANAQGCLVAEAEGRVCGTIASIIYESRLAWIGMVLVSPEHRGRGIATRLLEDILKRLQSLRVSTIKLDATPLGEPLYIRLGFAPECKIERWMANPVRRNPSGRAIRQHVEEGSVNLDEIIETDRAIFGAYRADLLRSLHAAAPAFTAAPRSGEALAGYTLGRRGLRADHLGPWMARDIPAAAYLLHHFLAQSARPAVIVDVFKSNPSAARLLHALDFQASRSLTRMSFGTASCAGRSESLYAILGPEFG